MIIAFRRRLSGAVGLLAAVAGALAAVHYYRLGLTLSHYDARGHLVVARRILDSITPGWQQIGAVWLPLPHLLNALPVQVDALYRTGASAVFISIGAFALTAAALSFIVYTLTGSVLASLAASLVLILDPNVLYLQSTPMTEPLMLGLVTAGVALLLDWVGDGQRSSTAIGLVLALACLTRYEAWAVTGCALVLSVWIRWRTGETPAKAMARVAAIGVFPALAIVGFLCFSRVVIGEWFVSSGFFVPENPALGHPMVALSQIVWGTETLVGGAVTLVAAAGLGWTLIRGLMARDEARGVLVLSLVATVALPWLAFVQGHPFRIRYVVPLIIAEAIGVGIVVDALLKRSTAVGVAAAGLVLGAALIERPPLDAKAAMVVEAQWDRPNIVSRQPLTDYVRVRYRGETIMASMGSLGHYMQEMSDAGFSLRDFLHEGNGDIWLSALNGPEPFVGWILIEEKAEGGDMLAKIARENPRFLRGFSRVMEGAGVALYERQNRMLNVAR